ncbi:hypothetical protein RBH29_01060 [Herbivorax sp. ANBcel31]|uniref:hypothetical protein n=1 Tax=Herbivorax sp. ANBcel31 TaxID=3069754 RepID=UPI0027B5FE02|nr:hypothetical protein [Herbivorax sp. ANBcel31]MDQ2085026.1 hypothetical protein [Herbivorax sp. ANBcel31]
MYIIYIKHYKRRIAIASTITFLWLIIFLVTSLFFNNSFFIDMIVDEYISFSHPVEYQIENIYINKDIDDISIETSHNFNKPITQNFSTHKSLKGELTFSYPSAFELNEQDFHDSEVLYHISFKNKNIHGFIQTWNLPYELDDFLKKSNSLSQQEYADFLKKPVTVNDIPGFYLSYTISTMEGKNIKGSEIFLKKNDKMYRISYFVPIELWDEKEAKIFWHIVDSFKVNN